MSRGFSLMELVVALVLLQVGILGTVGMVLQAQENFQRAELTLRGIVEGGRLADSLIRAGEPGMLRERWGEISWGPGTGPVASVRMVTWSAVVDDTLVEMDLLPRLPVPGRLAPGGLAPLGSW